VKFRFKLATKTANLTRGYHEMLCLFDDNKLLHIVNFLPPLHTISWLMRANGCHIITAPWWFSPRKHRWILPLAFRWLRRSGCYRSVTRNKKLSNRQQIALQRRTQSNKIKFTLAFNFQVPNDVELFIVIVKNRKIYIPDLYSTPLQGVIPSEFCEVLQ